MRPGEAVGWGDVQTRTKARHERILDAALEVFSSRGYRDASVDEVAAAAATSKGGIYFHFPGKDAIFLALLERSAKLLLSRVVESVEGETDPVAKVDAALLAVLRAFAGHRRLARLFLVEAMGAGSRFQARMLDSHARFVAFIKENLDEAVRRGIVRPLDTDVASQAWFGALNQVITRWVLTEGDDRLEDAYPALRALLLRSVGVDPRERTETSERVDASAVVRSAVTRARALGRPVLASWTRPVPVSDPLAYFVAGAHLGSRGYWERPDEALALVGLGSAWSYEGGGEGRFADAERAWRGLLAEAEVDDTGDAAPGPTVLGGFAFDPERPRTELWRGFGDARLVLPRFMLTRRGDAAWLTTCVMVEPNADPKAVARLAEEELSRHGAAAAAPAPGVVSVAEVQPAEEWRTLVAEASQAILRGAFEKVVLARSVVAQSRRAIPPDAVLDGLRTSYPSCAVFAVESGDGCFVGATPERLVRLSDGLVEVSALAGTARRGETDQEDEQIGAELMADPKNRHEHAVVVDWLSSRLAGVCEALVVPDEPRLLRVKNVQHLHTPIRGRLAPGKSMLDVVARLHPTPAVGGNPQPAAVAFIREREGMDRGWYAGPVGWLDRRGEGEMVVALRSGLLRGDEATLFAGCGIMDDSQPEAELTESKLKLRPMLGALGGTA